MSGSSMRLFGKITGQVRPEIVFPTTLGTGAVSVASQQERTLPNAHATQSPDRIAPAVSRDRAVVRQRPGRPHRDGPAGRAGRLRLGLDRRLPAGPAPRRAT